MQSINFFTSIPFHGVLFIDSRFAEGKSLAENILFCSRLPFLWVLKYEAQKYLLNVHGRVIMFHPLILWNDNQNYQARISFGLFYAYLFWHFSSFYLIHTSSMPIECRAVMNKNFFVLCFRVGNALWYLTIGSGIKVKRTYIIRMITRGILYEENICNIFHLMLLHATPVIQCNFLFFALLSATNHSVHSFYGFFISFPIFIWVFHMKATPNCKWLHFKPEHQRKNLQHCQSP